TELGQRLGLVEALQRAVVALVQPPVAIRRDPQPVSDLEGEVGGADGPALERGVDDVDVELRVPEELPAAAGLLLAEGREVHVVPAGEEVQLVPGALAVAEEDERRHGADDISPPKLSTGHSTFMLGDTIPPAPKRKNSCPRLLASISAPPTPSSPSSKAASPPSSRTPKAAARPRRSSPSPRTARSSSARWPSARRSPTPIARSAPSSATWARRGRP